MASQPQYKIKLQNGRILGPIGLDRIRLLILSEQIVGQELAREHPVGEWADINSYGPIGELLVSKALGTLEDASLQSSRSKINTGPTRIMEIAPTVPLTSPQIKEELKPQPAIQKTPPAPPAEPAQDDDATVVMRQEGKGEGTPATAVDDERTLVKEPSQAKRYPVPHEERPEPASLELYSVSEQRTVMLEKPLLKDQWNINDALQDRRKLSGAVNNLARKGSKNLIGVLATLSVIVLVYMLIDMGSGDSDAKQSVWQPIRATVPTFDAVRKDPSKSSKYYDEAMKFYIMDNVVGYRRAAEMLTLSVQYDSSNVKALAMLASSYLNLIDSSNKDENYFAVISKLIELSRANHIDLPETVIADVEFYITVNKAEAAQNRIVDYTKSQVTFDSVMFYYLALAFYHRGDAQSAVRYISEYPENKAFSPKLFYLRGQIAEALGDATSAMQEYEKAVRMSSNHAKSRLAIATLLEKSGQLQDAGSHLAFITKNSHLLSPMDQAKAFYLNAQLAELHKNDKKALVNVSTAVRLQPSNHDYLLELYSLEAKLGEDVQKTRGLARMYYFLGEGEKQLKLGRHHEALTEFLRALQANDQSPLPYVKIGDMYWHNHELARAMENYQKAAMRAPNNIDVWSKYIDSLIQSYEWQKAVDAMERFRKLNVPQSAIDKAAADMYAKQGDFAQSIEYYHKAMSRESVDSSVYISYAKVLIETKNFKEAPFFFALALRFDPLNSEALIGTAKCIAATESIDRAISFLQDELQKGSIAKAELLAAIADLYLQKGTLKPAEDYVNQAMEADSSYAYPYKIMAKIYLAQEGEKGMLDKALDAFKSYSDRNSSDPSGYLERYRVFIKKSEFERADDELMKIYAIYPKYPNLHFYKGALYSLMGNTQKAVSEYTDELKNNPNNVVALIALGKELVKGGNPAEAMSRFNKAMELSPRNSEAKAEGAYAAFMLKNYVGSIALYNAAIRLDPGNATLYKRLGIAYRDSGDPTNAQSAFHRYLELYPDAPDKAEYEGH